MSNVSSICDLFYLLYTLAYVPHCTYTSKVYVEEMRMQCINCPPTLSIVTPIRLSTISSTNPLLRMTSQTSFPFVLYLHSRNIIEVKYTVYVEFISFFSSKRMHFILYDMFIESMQCLISFHLASHYFLSTYSFFRSLLLHTNLNS